MSAVPLRRLAGQRAAHGALVPSWLHCCDPGYHKYVTTLQTAYEYVEKLSMCLLNRSDVESSTKSAAPVISGYTFPT